jgi:hypothetical protein
VPVRKWFFRPDEVTLLIHDPQGIGDTFCEQEHRVVDPKRLRSFMNGHVLNHLIYFASANFVKDFHTEYEKFQVRG